MHCEDIDRLFVLWSSQVGKIRKIYDYVAISMHFYMGALEWIQTGHQTTG